MKRTRHHYRRSGRVVGRYARMGRIETMRNADFEAMLPEWQRIARQASPADATTMLASYNRVWDACESIGFCDGIGSHAGSLATLADGIEGKTTAEAATAFVVALPEAARHNLATRRATRRANRGGRVTTTAAPRVMIADTPASIGKAAAARKR